MECLSRRIPHSFAKCLSGPCLCKFFFSILNLSNFSLIILISFKADQDVSQRTSGNVEDVDGIPLDDAEAIDGAPLSDSEDLDGTFQIQVYEVQVI